MQSGHNTHDLPGYESSQIDDGTDDETSDGDSKDCVQQFNISLDGPSWSKIAPRSITFGDVGNFRTRQKLQSGWTDIIASHVASQGFTCTFVGFYNYTTHSGVTHMSLKCSNVSGGSCPRILKVVSLQTGITGALFECSVFGYPQHNIVKPRQLRAYRRASVIKVAHKEGPSEARIKLINAAGFVTQEIPSVNVITTALSQSREKISGDAYARVRELHRTMQPQFLRKIGMSPFQITFWTTELLSLYRTQCRIFGRQVLGLDATGCLISFLPDEPHKDPLYYPIVLRHPVPGESQISICGMVSTSGDSADITMFLMKFKLAICNFESVAKSPAAIVIDFSWPLLHACCLAFNGLDVVGYLRRAFDLQLMKLSKHEIENISLVCLGRSHIMKEICCWKEIKREKRASVRDFWKYCFAAMVSSVDFKQLLAIWRSTCFVLLSEFNDQCLEHRQFLQKAFIFKNEVSVDEPVESLAEDRDLLGGLTTDIHESIKKQSPYFCSFHDIYVDTSNTLSQEMEGSRTGREADERLLQ